MPVFNPAEIPAEAKPLFALAEKGDLTPKEFWLALEKIGITNIRAMLYVSRAFNLPLEAAKTLMVESEY
jgi:hypothetical protein